MSELDPEDYEEKLKHLEPRHEILAAWIVVVFAALLFISLGSFLARAQHVIRHPHSFAPAITFFDPGDRIDWSDEDCGGHAVRKVCGHCGSNATPTGALPE